MLIERPDAHTTLVFKLGGAAERLPQGKAEREFEGMNSRSKQGAQIMTLQKPTRLNLGSGLL